MPYSTNISTNILRDASKQIDYVVTPNSKAIFDRIFLSNYGHKSFNLIGNYGTGKSTFLWALERNLNGEALFFNRVDFNDSAVNGFTFLKLVGEQRSLTSVLGELLKIKAITGQAIIDALEKKRKQALKKKHGLVLIIDEFGKFLEYASTQDSTDEMYLLQQISEWANNDANDTYFITTLHQNFVSYGKHLSQSDKLEWEKIKGRFVDLVFNEPVEQLIFFASKKLETFDIKDGLKERFNDLLALIENSRLVSHNKSVDTSLSNALYPLDWLSANVLVHSLQRYGQNERSLFSFLNDDTTYAIKNFTSEFYTVADVYDYLVNTLPTEINGMDNPHRAQWLTAFRALERAELVFDTDYTLATEVIKTITLVNIFSKLGGAFDKDFICSYFTLTKGVQVEAILDRLEQTGIIRFYKHSNKINFFEGTDIDLEQELITVSKELNPNINVGNEVLSLVTLPVVLVKRYSFETGTKRFFEYQICKGFDTLKAAEGAIDGYIQLVFDELKLSELKKQSKAHDTHIFVHYANSKEIKETLYTILKFDLLLKKHVDDKNALKLLNDERNFYVQQLNTIVLQDLFTSANNTWVYDGKIQEVKSKHNLNNLLHKVCTNIYSKTPVFVNELVNKHALSAPINTARKYLIRALLGNENLRDLGFDDTKYPPEKAIYISLLKQTLIHKANALGYYELSVPPKSSKLYDLWRVSEQFLNEALSNKRNLIELYELLLSKPYKLKKGLVDFWIPVFLIAKKEDYALFHKNGNYIPFLNEDTLDLIHRKPNDYLVKSYDVSGLKLNLLESYKELVQINGSSQGTQSTFLSIFGNFLRFQRGLNPYTIKTQKLSKSALRLRDAIMQSKDPEDALFNKFPAALGFHAVAIKDDENVLASYTQQIQEAIREIRTAYNDLLERVEAVIVNAFDCDSVIFSDYKQDIQQKLKSINTATLAQKQQVFYTRLLSPLDDRLSWIKSVADVALGKAIESMLDDEELLLVSNLQDLVTGLIKASEIAKFNEASNNGKLYSIRFYGADGTAIDEKTYINGNTSEAFKTGKVKVSGVLDALSAQERKDVLIELLSKELEK